MLWTEKSVKHRGKFLKLMKIPVGKIKKVGPARACFDKEFIIGRGCHGTSVYIGLWEDGTEVAVKRMLSDECASMSEKERRLLKSLSTENSEHIVKYRHFEWEETFAYLVVDLCEMTLEEYVESQNQDVLDKNGPVIIKELLTGLYALHNGQMKVLHMDLKPTNILVDAEGHMRLADFGLSRELSAEVTTLTTDPQGTDYWLSRESSVRDAKSGKVKFKRKSDVQVMGMISFYVLTKGGHPYGDVLDRNRNLVDGNPVNLPKINNSKARDLISRMLSSNINERPYVEEALRHSYINEKSYENC